MLQRDYILRLIQEFAAALQRLIEKKEIEDITEKLDKMYDQYIGPHAFYQTAEMDDVMDSFSRFNDNERMDRMEMLAQLYYVEADMKSEPTRTMLLQRALLLFDFIDRNGKTFSFDRRAKIDKIVKAIGRS
jgi:hypothetical protein